MNTQISTKHQFADCFVKTRPSRKRVDLRDFIRKSEIVKQKAPCWHCMMSKRVQISLFLSLPALNKFTLILDPTEPLNIVWMSTSRV